MSTQVAYCQCNLLYIEKFTEFLLINHVDECITKSV